MQIYVYLQGYNNDKEDFKKYCESFVADLFGRQYTGERVSLGYIAHIRALYRTVMRESWLWLQRTTF